MSDQSADSTTPIHPGDLPVRLALGGALPVILILTAVVVGLLALWLTPREEDPQIVVPNADVMVHAPSLSARQVERLVATPLEKALAQVDGVEHVYSVSETGRAVVSVRFFVGEDREDSLLKLYSKVYSLQDETPPAVTGWVVKPVEVDDVPVVSVALWSDSDAVSGPMLRRLAQEVANELQAVPGTNRTSVIGGAPREFRVLLDPTAMAGRATGVDDILGAFARSNLRTVAGRIDRAGQSLGLEFDGRLVTAADVERLTVNVIEGTPVRLGEIASVVDGPAESTSRTWTRFGAADARHEATPFESVTVTIAKQRGTNAVTVSRAVLERLAELEAELFPPGVHAEVTRDTGATADRKVDDLVSSLVVAVIVVVVLIGQFLGWRAALIVALAVPVCYGITLAADFAAGYSINRVTLFALILALGLLVDDPITGVDNMIRHLARGGDPGQRIIDAYAEIRTPLIMSTVAIVVVFAPIAFITGMMGPYMSPMAFNVPAAVIVSTIVAFMVTPWLGRLLLAGRHGAAETVESADARERENPYLHALRGVLASRARSIGVLCVLVALFMFAILLPALRVVPMKLLPYDNKNEFSVVIDGREGTTLESTDALANRLADRLVARPEVAAVHGYVGTHAPIDFNGMVRRYYLRGAPHEAELHVVLHDRLARPEQTHGLVLGLRAELAALARADGAVAKLVEVPPGPPVIATIVAELTGEPTTPYETLLVAAHALESRMAEEPGVVDLDTSARAPSTRLQYRHDQEKAALSGVSGASIATALAVLGDGVVAGHVAAPDEAAPLPIRLRVPYGQRDRFDEFHVKGMPGVAQQREDGGLVAAPTPLVSLAEIGAVREVADEQPRYHKDLRPVAYVYADLAGRVPVDVAVDVARDQGGIDTTPTPPGARTFLFAGGGRPWSLPEGVSMTWLGEGELDITVRVFRDLGIAFGVALVGLLVVLRVQTGVTAITLIIMLAIPLTAIGIMPGFWMLNAVTPTPAHGIPDPVLFTATAMIGMIALSGIVVRNALVLMEFIAQSRARGASVDDALIEACAARARPVLLTAGTTLLGNVVITFDPIFSGLAWAIMLGIAASTVLTLLVVPIVYKLVYGGFR